MGMTLQSDAFCDGAPIPARYTCDGKDVSPLHWSGAPEHTKSFALIMEDPDAPDPAAPQRTWIHWVLFNLPRGSTAIPEAAERSSLGADTRPGLNDWNRTGYGGPCPPIGRHRYIFRLYAMDRKLEGLDVPVKSELNSAMQGHILDRAELVGLYQRKS